MTKKYFIALADALRGADPSPAVLDALCRFCRGQNPNFKEERWREYLAGECGPSGGRIRRPSGRKRAG